MTKAPSNHGKAWSAADDAELRHLAEQNTPTRVMGLKLGRTEDAVRAHASELDVSVKPTNQAPYGTKGR